MIKNYNMMQSALFGTHPPKTFHALDYDRGTLHLNKGQHLDILETRLSRMDTRIPDLVGMTKRPLAGLKPKVKSTVPEVSGACEADGHGY